jgi:hypothetical protein
MYVSLISDRNSGHFAWWHTYIADDFSPNSVWMGNVSHKRCTENQNKTFYFNKCLRKSCRLWDNVEKYRAIRQTTCKRLTTKATDRYSDYAILLSFPLQQWLHERASMLYYTNFDSLVTRICLEFYIGLYLCVRYVSQTHNFNQMNCLNVTHCGALTEHDIFRPVVFLRHSAPKTSSLSVIRKERLYSVQPFRQHSYRSLNELSRNYLCILWPKYFEL